MKKTNADLAMQRTGRMLASGVLIECGKYLIYATLAIALANLVDRQWHFTTWDSTDRQHEKSGLRIRTDALTGCEYLESQDGALIPRMRADGHQICASALAGN